MRLPNWKTCAGYLVVIAVLALSLPGVRAVRADEGGPVISVNLVDSGPSCGSGSASGAERSVALFLEGAADRPGSSRPVALNTQGYGYRPPSILRDSADQFALPRSRERPPDASDFVPISTIIPTSSIIPGRPRAGTPGIDSESSLGLTHSGSAG